MTALRFIIIDGKRHLWCKIAPNFDPTHKATYVVVNAGQYWNIKGRVSRPTVTPPNPMIMQ